MPIQSLENLEFADEKKIVANEEPAGAEVSTFVQWDDDVSGEISSRDKKIPRLNIGQKSGALGEHQGFGALVLNKEVVIAPFGQSLDATVLKIQKRYMERLPYDPNRTGMPRMFGTAKEAVEAGYSTEWGDKKVALPVAFMMFFFPAPSGLDKDVVEQNFVYEFNGLHYAAALYMTSPTGYRETASPVFSAMDTPRVKEFGSPRIVRWKATVIKRQNAVNSWFLLKMVTSGYNQPELVAYTKEILP
jgi:hypothetical protein